MKQHTQDNDGTGINHGRFLECRIVMKEVGQGGGGGGAGTSRCADLNGIDGISSFETPQQHRFQLLKAATSRVKSEASFASSAVSERGDALG